MKLPEDVIAAFDLFDDETAGLDWHVSTDQLTQMLTDFIRSRERKAFNRARAATMQEKHEGITGHLVDGLKFVHDDFEHYQASEEYEK